MSSLKKSLLALVLLVAGLLNVSPALAHTEVDHTSPAANSSIEAGTQTISVVFSDKILNLADSSEIVITDENGEEVVTSCLETNKTSLDIEAFLGTAGDYKVVWRTVAEDGHPITGKFGFTVTGTSDDSAFVSCKDLAAETPVVIATPKAEPLAAEAPKTNSDGAVIWPYATAAVLVIAVGGFVLLRRKSTKE
jgi:methionine-rich copper-binding protein CopC